MKIKPKLYEIENNLNDEITDINEFIFRHPELWNQEFKSSQYLVDKLKNMVWSKISISWCSTAFRAGIKKERIKD